MQQSCLYTHDRKEMCLCKVFVLMWIMFELRERASLLPVFCKNNEFNEGCNYSALKLVHILLLILALVRLFYRNNEHFSTNCSWFWLETFASYECYVWIIRDSHHGDRGRSFAGSSVPAASHNVDLINAKEVGNHFRKIRTKLSYRLCK